jgi:hypothetical protein
MVATTAKLRARSFTLDGEAMVSGVDGIAVFESSTGGAGPQTRCVCERTDEDGATAFRHAWPLTA